MAKILVVDDDEELLAMVNEWLVFEHHTVEAVTSGNDALSRLLCNFYDLVVLDITLPDINGIDILQQYRDSGGTAPVLFLTGRDKVSDKEQGLDGGADDYVCKPFNVRELSARVRALLRRSRALAPSVLVVGTLELDPIKYKVTKDGVALSVTPRDFALLEFFMRNPDQVFSAESLLARVWLSESDATNEAIRASIKRLRKVIDTQDDESKSLIENVPRVGYRLRST